MKLTRHDLFWVIDILADDVADCMECRSASASMTFGSGLKLDITVTRPEDLPGTTDDPDLAELEFNY